jgi:hypothetical protein
MPRPTTSVARISAAAAMSALASMASVPPARADQTATLPDGRTVLLRDNGTWQIQPKAEAPAGTYKSMRMAELKVDLKELVGRKVSVAAVGYYLTDQLIIGDPTADYDMNGINVKIDDLPRDVRLWIITKCADRCRVTVEGEVSTGGLFGPGIIAHSVKNRP